MLKARKSFGNTFTFNLVNDIMHNTHAESGLGQRLDTWLVHELVVNCIGKGDGKIYQVPEGGGGFCKCLI